MTDQLRGDALGYAGHPDVKTPYLDTLADNGAVFENAYSTCPSCIAARAELMTGLLPEHNKRVGYQDDVRWDYPVTLAGELSKAGYYTICTGKMHVYPIRNYLGFDNVELHDGYLHAGRYSDVPSAGTQQNADDYYHYLKNEKGIDADPVTSGLECNSWVARPWQYEEKYHPTNWVTDRAIDFLRRRDPDKPFFLMASYLAPHPPFNPPAYYMDMYKGRTLRKPFIGSWEEKEEPRPLHVSFDSRYTPDDPELVHQMQAGYYGLITHLDHQIGRIIQALREYRLENDTLIVFTSDHGEELGDHNLFRKSRPYEGSSHIPMFISGLQSIGLEKYSGSRFTQVTALCDIMPTLLDVAGAEAPAKLDGTSLLTVIKDKEASTREYLHSEHSYGALSAHWLVSEHDKYVWYTEDGREQYFDLDADPHELNNGINDRMNSKRISYLRSEMIKVLENRPEGFSDGSTLISGRPYPPLLGE